MKKWEDSAAAEAKARAEVFGSGHTTKGIVMEDFGLPKSGGHATIVDGAAKRIAGQV